MDLKGSKTEKNLQAAFAGESQARNKYTYYASKARKDGYEQIAELFLETANNEKEHAKIWFKLLHDGDIPTTVENLKDAADGELHLRKDPNHLNIRGKYLQACVWFAFLYGKSPEETAKYFQPEEIGNTDAAFLRAMAEKAARTPFDEIN